MTTELFDVVQDMLQAGADEACGCEDYTCAYCKALAALATLKHEHGFLTGLPGSDNHWREQIATLTRENERLTGERDETQLALRKAAKTKAWLLFQAEDRVVHLEGVLREARIAVVNCSRDPIPNQFYRAGFTDMLMRVDAALSAPAEGNEGIPHAQPSSLDGENAESEISDASR